MAITRKQIWDIDDLLKDIFVEEEDKIKLLEDWGYLKREEVAYFVYKRPSGEFVGNSLEYNAMQVLYNIDDLADYKEIINKLVEAGFLSEEEAKQYK